MSERFASDLLFIVVALLIAAILGFLIGYFLRKPKVITKEIIRDTGGTGAEDVRPDFDAETAKAMLGKKIVLDDLKIVEGIGPVIEGILKNSGIDTWKKLAESKAERIGSILTGEGGARFRAHDPGTWPEQAGLALQGQWEELKKLQDRLLGGRVRR
ncbi:MAG TPA: hypothetical protein ENO20_02735 [Bacteroides sp.]|nr:hypothetical protein [Bacteroides sp.]